MRFRRHLLLPLAAWLIVLLLASGCSQRGKGSGTLIVTSFLPVQDLVLDLAGDFSDVRVTNLAPTGAGCPNHYTLTPGDLALVHQADIVVTHGLGMDGWLKRRKTDRDTSSWFVLADTLKDLYPDVKTLESNEEHNAPRPHTWVAPDLLAREALFLGGHLAATMPQHADTILARARILAATLDSLHGQYRSLADSACHPEIASFHTSFNVLAERTGLRVGLVLQNDPDVPPGPQETAKAIDALKNGRFAALISEPQINPRFVLSVQKESGKTVYTLDPVVTGDPARGALLIAQRDNLAELREALGVTQ
ncbi:MAG: metal ABC transporter substrate-binding protein [bacterium]